MICYDRLWATMEAMGMTQYKLIKQHSFSAGQIGRLKKNMHVSTHTLDTLCSLLGCGIGDIIEYIPEGAPLTEELPVREEAGLTEAAALSQEGIDTGKPAAAKADKAKKTGKSKKNDKKSAKDGKKSKDSKKSKS